MKRILKQTMVAMMFLILFCISSSATAWAGASYLEIGENLSWTLENGILTVKGIGAMNDFMPGTYPEWYGNKLHVKKVVIENGVTSIGNYAFSKFGYMESISIPNSVKSIGAQAFEDCEALKELTIPGSVKSIGAHAFGWCKALKELTIPKGVRSIEQATFVKCEALETVTIPNTVTTIKDHAFEDCGALRKVHIPGSVTSIGDYAFDGCASLTDLKISEGLKIIGEGALWGCKASSITVPSTVTKIGRVAFFYSKAKKIYFLGKKPSIASDAFMGVNATAYYPKSWKKAPSSDYGGYLIWKKNNTILDKGDVVTDKKTNGIYKITGKNTVTYMKPNVKKSIVVVPSKVKLKKVNYKVTAIANSAFAGNLVLRKITISSGVKKIGKKAFYNCKALKIVVIKTSTLKKNSIGSKAFKGINTKATIKVPKSKFKSYKSILKVRGVSSKVKFIKQ